MAFQSYSSTTGETCDRCKKPVTLDFPGLALHVSTRYKGEGSYIVLHYNCLDRATDSARKDLAERHAELLAQGAS